MLLDPGVFDGSSAIYPLSLVFFEELADQVFGFLAYVAPLRLRELVFGAQDFVVDGVHVLSAERLSAAEHDIENDAQTPHIDSESVGRVFYNLRGHIEGRADEGELFVLFSDGEIEDLREAKIDDFDFAVFLVFRVEKDVFWFQVSVDDFFGVHVAYG